MTGVMGFIAQCEVCPQKAILTDQLEDGWVCPRCVEVTAPAFAVSTERVDADPEDIWPGLQRGDMVAVQLADGTLRTGRYDPSQPDNIEPDADAVKRGYRTIEGMLAYAESLDLGFNWKPKLAGHFGDVDIAAAEPVAEPPQPLTIPVDDPLAAAIVAEVKRSPDRPYITALVNGRSFVFGGYTQRAGEPLSTVWIDEDKLRLASSTMMTAQRYTRYPWGDPIPEDELPYRPPTKDHAYRAPTADDDYDLGQVQG